MLNQFSRTQLLYGEETMGRLLSSRVAVFGIGGVGGYVDKLQAALYLPAGNCQKMYRAQRYPWINSICSFRGRTDHSG